MFSSILKHFYISLLEKTNDVSVWLNNKWLTRLFNTCMKIYCYWISSRFDPTLPTLPFSPEKTTFKKPSFIMLNIPAGSIAKLQVSKWRLVSHCIHSYECITLQQANRLQVYHSMSYKLQADMPTSCKPVS